MVTGCPPAAGRLTGAVRYTALTQERAGTLLLLGGSPVMGGQGAGHPHGDSSSVLTCPHVSLSPWHRSPILDQCCGSHASWAGFAVSGFTFLSPS